MSRRGRPRIETRTGRYGENRAGRWSSPWVIRGIVIVAVAIVAVALLYAGLHGFLFALPKR